MKAKSKNIKRVHDEVVGKILASSHAPRRMPSPGVQWLLWLLISILTTLFILFKAGVQELGPVLNQMPPVLFLVLAFLGASLAAWEAIASSVPGRQTTKGRRTLSAVVVALLFLMPFLFFTWGEGQFNLWDACCSGLGCIEGCSLAGFVPWVVLGFILSRNASFDPIWTGAWSGVSAFLMGTFTIQLHCPAWDTGHMFVTHLLPVAAFTFLAAFLGAFWFSRWKK